MWHFYHTWWRHQMETFSALLAICAGNSPVPGEFPAQRPVTRSFDVYFDLRPKKRLSKQSWGWWFETPSHSLWRHRNDLMIWHGVILFDASLVLNFCFNDIHRMLVYSVLKFCSTRLVILLFSIDKICPTDIFLHWKTCNILTLPCDFI